MATNDEVVSPILSYDRHRRPRAGGAMIGNYGHVLPNSFRFFVAVPRPADRLLFAPTRDRYGVRLALVFGNHAPGGQCPYYAAGKCRHCDIGSGEGAPFTADLNRQRLAWFQEQYCQVLPEVGHLVLYNSGSLLDPREMPAAVLDEILAWARTLPRLRVVSLEARERAVTRATVCRVAATTGAGRTVRIVLGIETADERLRNIVLAKAMPLAAVHQAAAAIRLAAVALGPERIGLTFNILIGGPGTSAPTAMDDAVATARVAVEIGRSAGVPVDLNLHPYYRSARGRLCFPDHPGCPPRTVALVAAAVAELAAGCAPPAAVFIGANDEGHDLRAASPAWHADDLRKAIENFNQTQDPSVLGLLCGIRQ